MTYVFYTNDDFVHNPHSGGVKRFKELICGLLETGERIHLFIPPAADIPDYPNLKRYPLKRKDSRFLPNGLLNLVCNYKKLRSIRKISADRVVFISIPYAIQGILAGIRNFTLIAREDFIAYRKLRYEQSRLPRFWISLIIWILHKTEGQALKHADRIIMQCAWDKNNTLKRHKKHKKRLEPRIHILYNNVNPGWIQAEAPEKVPGHADHVAPYDLAFIGTINHRRKGLHLLLDAAKELINQGYSIKLHIMGDGKLRRFYQNACADYPEIVFHGYVEHPMAILAKMDLLVVPSLSDSFPNTIMEALFLEIPVLGTRIGGIPEMLLYDELLVEPENKAIFNKIADTIDQNKWQSLNDLARKRKQALNFDWVAKMSQLI